MRYRLLLSLLFSGCLFSLTHHTLAATTDIKISEVLIGGEKASDSDEFVELYNQSATAIDLSGFRLRYQNSKGTEGSLAVIKPGSCIPAHGHFLWANSKGVYASVADLTTSTALTDNYTVLLYAPESSGALLDSVSWGDATTPPAPPVTESLVRNFSDLTWLSTHATPTPTKSINCVLPEPAPTPDPAPPQTSDAKIRFNEIFSNPKGDEVTGEFIELLSSESSETDISGWTIRDASKTGKYAFPAGTILPPQSFFVLSRSVSKISLNNSDETLSLYDTLGALVDTVTYEKSKEGVSQNRVGNSLRGGTPTPGAANQLNALPETKEKVPKKGYRGLAIAFDARGKDADGGKLKYTWDFGDGHKSYKEETTHKYLENGTYTITLTTTDGSDDVTEAFTLKITSLPKANVRITAMVPNPSGKDSDREWLMIENRGKKSVDLKGYGIATGWKKLSNHPIRESFVISPKSQAKLTREFSLFTLPNEKGKIELRAPDGKVLQEIKYKLAKSAAEDAVYQKEKGKRWTWQESAHESSVSENEPIDEVVDEPIDEMVPEEAPDTIPLEETAPEEDVIVPVPAQEEKQVLGVTTEATQPFLPLLNYGTRVKLPSDIRLSFVDQAPELLVKDTTSDTGFRFSEPLPSLNALLNNWQNRE